jgi:hypothetical protein
MGTSSGVYEARLSFSMMYKRDILHNCRISKLEGIFNSFHYDTVMDHAMWHPIDRIACLV